MLHHGAEPWSAPVTFDALFELPDVASAPNGIEALAQVMRYILLVNNHVEPEALQAFLDRV
ncbi:MAG: hypothetical protein ABIY55_05740 [Kofleriaceae bacterium]